MHLKLRYRGRLKSPADVPQLIREVEDICRSNGWDYQIWDEDWSLPASVSVEITGQNLNFKGHAPLKGITLSIGKSEIVWLTFQPDGMLQSLFTLANPTFTAESEDFPWQRVKTGDDGPKDHLAICKLFHYLAGSYFEVFEVRDESGYWKHGDDARFIAWFESLALALEQLEQELALVKADESLSAAQKREAAYRLIKSYGAQFRIDEGA